MTVDWQAFTPGAALAGGLILGLASAVLILLAGRVAGISGIVGGLLWPVRGDRAWRAAFVAGLLAAPWLYGSVVAPLQPQIDAGWALVVAAGLLVGIGTRLGSGCTSGHGICGLARRSPRSLVAVLSFMAAGVFAASLLRHVL